MLDICTLGDEILREKCTDITEFDDALKILIDAMLDTLKEADGIGLAGPQVGVPKRIFVVWLPSSAPMVFINPEIIETGLQMVPYEEGCLSIPGMFHNVMRPDSVTIQAFDADGKAFTIKASGQLARVIQHENDHLSGKLYIDHLSEEERDKLLRAYEKKNRSKKNRKRFV